MKIKNFKSSTITIGVVFLAAICVLIFFFEGLHAQAIGFPLDDAWIHQTYARNFAQSLSWSYNFGTISGGSTSPLWTLLISIGYFISPKIGIYWTFLLSGVFFIGLVWVSVQLIRIIMSEAKYLNLLLACIVFILEWHLLWAAGSGMETILYSFSIMLTFLLLVRQTSKWFLIGLVIGVSVWVRPDGLALLGPAVFILFFDLIKKQGSWKNILKFGLPFLGLFMGYVVFNYLTTGRIFPNTFYAKQVEYSSLLQIPFTQRYLNESLQIITGVGAVLLPGFVFEISDSIKNRNYRILAVILWILGYVAVYAIQLPVTYQHGRYIIPVIFPFIFVSLIGIFDLLKIVQNKKISNLIFTFWIGSALVVSLAFYLLGIKSYREDIAFINQMMVQPAQWSETAINSDAIIAVHDIGAMGYFSGHKLIDMAGLVNPGIIPYMHDEEKLLKYIKSENASYFIGLSDWYQTSSSWGEVVKRFKSTYQNKQVEIDVLKLK